MATKSNPYLEKLERKHPKLFFAIYLITSLLGLFIGICLLFVDSVDKSIPILMIVGGTAGVISAFLLNHHKK